VTTYYNGNDQHPSTEHSTLPAVRWSHKTDIWSHNAFKTAAHTYGA